MLCSAHIVLGPSLWTKLGLFLFVRSIRSRSASYLAIKKSLRRVSQTKDKFGPRHIYIGLSYLFENRHLSLLFAIGCLQCELAYFHVLNNLRNAQKNRVSRHRAVADTKLVFVLQHDMSEHFSANIIYQTGTSDTSARKPTSICSGLYTMFPKHRRTNNKNESVIPLKLDFLRSVMATRLYLCTIVS